MYPKNMWPMEDKQPYNITDPPHRLTVKSGFSYV